MAEVSRRVSSLRERPRKGKGGKETLVSGETPVPVADAKLIETAKSGNYRYLLISPCRDEAEYMRQTLDSVISQSIPPAKWIIVDDGSTDNTPQTLAEYRAKYDWIEIVTRSNRGRRAVGPGVVDAFYAGYETINPDDYEYLCKLDLDLRLPPRYFEILMDRMTANPRIATCSGKAYLEENGRLVFERHADDVSIGASKFYRVSCFKMIGGFVRELMWDGIDCHRCRANGWIACSWDEPELRFIHLRPEGSSQKSIYSGRMRHGYGQYFMGTGFLFIVASAIYRLNRKPYVLGSLAMIWGWLKAALEGKPRYEDAAFRKFLRQYQRRALWFGKKRAIEEIDKKSRLA
jgi:biofilm PGA synthesis N-glycosyltransferase PgaC